MAAQQIWVEVGCWAEMSNSVLAPQEIRTKERHVARMCETGKGSDDESALDVNVWSGVSGNTFIRSSSARFANR